MSLHLRAVTILEKELRTATLLNGEADPLDLRQCSSSPTVEQSLRSGRGTTMIGTVSTGRCPMLPARDRSGTRGMTWALAIALLTKLRRASPAVAMVIVLETLSALAAEPVQISNKESFHIFSDSKYAKRLNSAVSNEYLYLLTTSSCVNRVRDFVEPQPFEYEIKENRKK